jgi:sucrose phosphorylase
VDKINKIKEILVRMYGEEKGALAMEKIESLLERFPKKEAGRSEFFSQEDVVLITYGDTLIRKNESPLSTLHQFACQHLEGAVSAIHFLPFFPYSSDDGFSVMDFHAINPDLGDWNDVVSISEDFELMLDYVVNHFSSKGKWFDNYLSGEKGFEDFAIEVDPAVDLSMVTRPRSLPLLSTYKKTDDRTVYLWTTFSADQIDFNFKSLNVLEKMIEVLLFYVQQGAAILRLDAIAYLWKEIGTDCIHLPQTHDAVKLMRSILDVVAPDTMIVTETNVPHEENISYFGDGRNEAQMVYNFTLPPLLFYTFVKQDAGVLTTWVKSLELKKDTITFFNFTASHDGIGVRPLEGILAPEEIEELIDVVTSCGGQVSTKRNPDGTDSPYELNITYIDAILADATSQRAEKFLASQAIQYSLPGVPATYIHSLLGSRNWLEGVSQTGRARTINREKLDVKALLHELDDPDSFRSKIFFPYLQMIRIRGQQPAFHPNAGFDILDVDSRIFAIKRFSQDQIILAFSNVSGERVNFMFSEIGIPGPFQDLVTGERVEGSSYRLEPYQFIWLVPE